MQKAPPKSPWKNQKLKIKKPETAVQLQAEVVRSNPFGVGKRKENERMTELSELEDSINLKTALKPLRTHPSVFSLDQEV